MRPDYRGLFFSKTVTIEPKNRKGYQMTIAEQLTEDMKESMRSGDSVRTGTLRLLRGAIKNEEIKIGHPLDDADVLKVLQREAKQRRDSIESYRGAGREDLAIKEEAELTILSTYLPEQLSEESLHKVIDEVVVELGASTMAQMGAVVGAVIKRVGAQAEGSTVSRLVREKLSK